MNPAKIFAAGLSFLLLAGCSPYRPFYFPNRNLYSDPDKLNLTYEMWQYPSLNGKKLFGLYFPTAEGEPKGLVVHFHGNFGNVSSHFPMSHFLTRYGYDVLVFDYQGYGDSEGRPSPRRMFEDGVATLRYAAGKNRSPGNLFVLGHSLGGAVALSVLASGNLGVRAAVIQAAFTRYRAMARHVLKQSVVTWALYPFYPLFLGTRWDAARVVALLARAPSPESSEGAARAVETITGLPLFFIHGDADEIVPLFMTRELYAAAKEPKELWIVEGAGHNDLRSRGGAAYEKRVAEFFDKNLLRGSTPK